jgi:hypothetical protein
MTAGIGIPADAVAQMRSAPVQASVPALVIAGGASPERRHDAMRAPAGALPDAEHRRLEGRSHEVSPDAFAPVPAECFAERLEAGGG